MALVYDINFFLCSRYWRIEGCFTQFPYLINFASAGSIKLQYIIVFSLKNSRTLNAFSARINSRPFLAIYHCRQYFGARSLPPAKLTMKQISMVHLAQLYTVGNRSDNRLLANQFRQFSM